MVNPLAPIAAKLSVNFCFMASIAVLMPTTAMIPKAMIATVIPVRSLLPRIVLQERLSVSIVRMLDQITQKPAYRGLPRINNLRHPVHQHPPPDPHPTTHPRHHP